MPQLDDIIRVFPENGIRQPSPEVIAKICAIDNAVHGTRDQLEDFLCKLESENRTKWQLGGDEAFWNGFERTPMARFPEHDGTQFTDIGSLLELHKNRYQSVVQIFDGQEGVSVEDGGIKSYMRAKKKLDKRRELGKPDHCPDLSRIRLVVSGLARMEEAYHRLRGNMPLQQIGTFSHYSKDIIKRYLTPFRGVNTTWGGDGLENPDDQIATEVQLVTDRVRTVVDLDHPFNVAKTLKYPNIDAEDYVHALMLKASILDFKAAFGV